MSDSDKAQLRINEMFLKSEFWVRSIQVQLHNVGGKNRNLLTRIRDVCRESIFR